MMHHAVESGRKGTGEHYLPDSIAELLVELAQPSNSARIGLLPQFETEMGQAVENFAASSHLNCFSSSLTSIRIPCDAYYKFIIYTQRDK